jgi:hypothetical protein
MHAGIIGAGAVFIILASLILGLIFYFVPSFVAFARRHPQRGWILLVNIFAGWTFIGWVGALIWTFITPDGQFEPFASPDEFKTCPRCAEKIKRAAFVCRFCGYEFGGPPIPPPPPLR